MDLVIKHKRIDEPIPNILQKIKNDNPGYLKDIKKNSQYIICTCPFHGNHNERTPACFINIGNEDIPYGTYHCFACGEAGPLSKLVAKCYEIDDSIATEFGENWLVENYGDTYVEDFLFLPEIDLSNEKPEEELPKNILESFQYDNPIALDYLTRKRHLIKPVIDYFKIGYNRETESITFPCWDTHDKLVGIFERNVYTKRFKIPQIYPKPIYLLNEAIKQGYTTIYLCESQINALTLYSWGYPAIALFGTGSKEQYEILRRSGIRNYILCFDGDNAGLNGRNKFIKNMGSSSIILYKNIPFGKDVNDLTLEEFNSLPLYNA